jgi:hypothetical protein
LQHQEKQLRDKENIGTGTLVQPQVLHHPTQKSVQTASVRSPSRSKPQDLMLTTFDISSSSDNSSSGSSTEDRSPIAPQSIFVVTASTSQAAASRSAEDEEEEEDKGAGQLAGDQFRTLDDDFYEEDDFGLSAIRQEAELLRLQQLRVEAEIARIQREEAEGKGGVAGAAPAAVRQIPDKPPPPYVPPPGQAAATPSPVAAPKPARPPPLRTFLPCSREKVGALVEQLAEEVFRLKMESGSWDALAGIDSVVEMLVERELAAVGMELRNVYPVFPSHTFDLMNHYYFYLCLVRNISSGFLGLGVWMDIKKEP